MIFRSCLEIPLPVLSFHTSGVYVYQLARLSSLLKHVLTFCPLHQGHSGKPFVFLFYTSLIFLVLIILTCPLYYGHF